MGELFKGLAAGREASLKVLRDQTKAQREVDPYGYGGDDNLRFAYGVSAEGEGKNRTALYGPSTPQMETAQLIGAVALLLRNQDSASLDALLRRFAPSLPLKMLNTVRDDPGGRPFGVAVPLHRVAPVLMYVQAKGMGLEGVADYFKKKYPEQIEPFIRDAVLDVQKENPNQVGTYTRDDFIGPRENESTYMVDEIGNPMNVRLHGSAATGYSALITAAELAGLKRLYDDYMRLGILAMASEDMVTRWKQAGIMPAATDVRGPALGSATTLLRARSLPTEESLIEAAKEEKAKQIRRLTK